jgi:hypothetical protein
VIRTILPVCATVLGTIAISALLAAISDATGSSMWWNGYPWLIVFVVLGVVVRRFTGIPIALASVVAAAFAEATVGYVIESAMNVPGIVRRSGVMEDDLPWVTLGLSIVGAFGVLIGSIRLQRRAR